MDIGEKIKRLRTKNNLTQEELANRCELTKGFISQVERNLTSPSIASLVDILESLGTNLKDFFADSVPEKVVFSLDDRFVQPDDQLRHQIEWIVPNAQKNLMEPIIITMESNGQSKLDQPHEGEEFGYVMCGAILVHLDDKLHMVSSGECYHYKSGTVHYISNAGKTPAKVLWVSTPPSF